MSAKRPYRGEVKGRKRRGRLLVRDKHDERIFAHLMGVLRHGSET